MAKRVLYFGPFNNKKNEELIRMSIDKLKKNQGNKFYYLLPNGELLTDYRRNFIQEVEHTFEINLYTFDNIVNNILGDRTYTRINDAIKDLVIKRVIRDLVDQGEIIYYKDFIHMEGFAKSLNGIIGEIKRSIVGPEEFLDRSPVSPYYQEIGLIYKKYEDYLKTHNLIDREGSYFKAIEILKNGTGYFDGLEFIVIDGFYDFRPIEIAILEELCKSNIDIYINIPFHMEAEPYNITETINILKTLGFSLEYVEKEEENQFERLGRKFFSPRTDRLNYNENLSLVKSPSMHLELKKIFEKIKKLHKEGTSLDHMAIVLLSEDYKDRLFQVAREENIPISLEREISVKETPIVKEFLNLIRVQTKQLEKQSIINRVKSSYFSIIDSESKHGLEYVLRKLNFNSIADLQNLLLDEKELNLTMDYMDPIKDISRKIKDEMSKVRDKDRIKNYNQIFLQLIDDYNIREAIYNLYRLEKDFNLLFRDLLSLEKLKKGIEGLNEISNVVDAISIEDYLDILSRLFEEDTIILEDRNINGVRILNPINGRGFNHEVIFILGLSQAHYPKLKESNFLINDENYNDLKNIGLDVKSYHERLNNEVVKFASLLSTASKKIYLSFSEGLEGEDISSIFLDEILNMIEGDRIGDKLKFVNLDLKYLIKDNINQITTEEELSNYLLLHYRKDLSDDLKKYFALHNKIHGDKLKSINSKALGELKRNKEKFNEYSGLIGQEEIIKDIRQENKSRIYSNTFLEAYSKCPYAFLLSRILKVEEMERTFEEYSPLDIGNIYHEVLNHYYRQYKGEITDYVKGVGGFNIDDSLENLKELVYRYGREVNLHSENRASLLILENTYDHIKGFIEKDLERISNPKEKLIPYGFEVEFGKREEFTIEVEGEKIRLSGVIDRIDKLINEDKYVVMDYKSSKSGIYNLANIREGVSLQLPIYAMSQKDKNTVAGFYATIRDKEFHLAIGILEESKLVSNRHGGKLTKEEWTSLMESTKEKIKEIKDNILEANFPVDPLRCSTYCIYRDICRYEKVEEVE